MRKPGWFRQFADRNRRRAAGIVQNIIIAALAVSAVFLAGNMAGFDLNSEINAYSQAARGDGGTQREYAAAAEPMCIVVTPGEGIHSAAMYDARTLNEYYALGVSALAEALGSAGEPEEVGENAWRSALSGPGIYFDYYTDCQLSTIAIWQSAEMRSSAASHSARRLCLSIQGDEVFLYYIREKYGTFWRCTTELSYTELMGRVSSVQGGGAKYVFETDGELADVDQYMVLTDGELPVRSVTGENALNQNDAERIMTAFGMNPNLSQHYPESDGTDVYLEGGATLRLGTDGLIRYTRRDIQQPGESLSPADAVELTRRLLENTAGLSSSAASLRLSYIFFDRASQEYTLRYDYAIDGLTVSLQGRECAAEFRLVGDAISEAYVLMRSYSYTGDMEQPLPARLEAALVQAEGGGEPRLSYLDSYTRIYASWLIV